MDIKIVISPEVKDKEKRLLDYLNTIDYNARPFIMKELAILGLEIKKEVETKFYSSLKTSLLNSVPKQPDPPRPISPPIIAKPIPVAPKIVETPIDEHEKPSMKDRLLSLARGNKK